MRHLVTYTFTFYQKYATGNQNFCVRYCCISESHEVLLKVRRLSWFFSTTTPTPSRRRVVIFFHDDAKDSTSTTSRCFFHDVGH